MIDLLATSTDDRTREFTRWLTILTVLDAEKERLKQKDKQINLSFFRVFNEVTRTGSKTTRNQTTVFFMLLLMLSSFFEPQLFKNIENAM